MNEVDSICTEKTCLSHMILHAFTICWQLDTHKVGPILDLISVRLLDAARHKIKEKCALLL